MADYIYLLDNRLSEAQREALSAVREVARAKGLTLFLVGGAVRDLTSGSPVRDLDVVVQGNAAKLRKDLEAAGGATAGSYDPAHTLFLKFPGGVRMEVGSTMSATYPKPGKPVMKPATILDDLRRRDFTANAMALSLNEGSYGLLMDPLNGVADIENRELRLASNYGFIEDPARMIRAMRFAARLGWELEEKTRTRYETGKQEGYIGALDEFHRGYEAEEIVHEEDPLRVMRRLEAEGWMQVLAPGWTVAKANLAEMDKVRETLTQLELQGVHPDTAAVHFPLLTAKVAAKDVAALKKSFPRQGFVAEIEALEEEAKEFAAALGGRGAAAASAAYKTITSARPEALLYVAYTTKSGALQAKLKSFTTEWPAVRQKIPYALMQEMRITPEIAGYAELVEKLFFELMDGKLATAEEIKAFLEPYSPPAPPPPVSLRRPRSSKKDAKGKGKAKKGAVVEAEDEDGEALDLDGEETETSRGVEEDLEAEEAAEQMHAVRELGGPVHEDEPLEELEDLQEDHAAPSMDEKADQTSSEESVASRDIGPEQDGEPEPVAPEAITESVPERSLEVTTKKQVVEAAKTTPAKKTVAAPTESVGQPVKQSAVSVAKNVSKGNIVKPAPPKRAVPVKGAVSLKATQVKAATAKAAPVKAGPAKPVPAKAVTPKSAAKAKGGVKIAVKGRGPAVKTSAGTKAVAAKKNVKPNSAPTKAAAPHKAKKPAIPAKASKAPAKKAAAKKTFIKKAVVKKTAAKRTR